MSAAAAYGSIKGDAGALIAGLVPMLALMLGLLIVLFLVSLAARFYLGRGDSRTGGVALPGGSAGVFPSFPLGFSAAEFTAKSVDVERDTARANRDAAAVVKRLSNDDENEGG